MPELSAVLGLLTGTVYFSEHKQYLSDQNDFARNPNETQPVIAIFSVKFFKFKDNFFNSRD